MTIREQKNILYDQMSILEDIKAALDESPERASASIELRMRQVKRKLYILTTPQPDKEELERI